MRSHFTISPTQISAREVRSLLLHRNIPYRIVNGWSLTTYDNHDRSKKALLQGDRLLKIEQLTHISARVHHILYHILTAEDALNALHIPLSPYTVDFHLINLVFKEFTLPFYHNPLPFHPGLEDLDSLPTQGSWSMFLTLLLVWKRNCPQSSRPVCVYAS
jgi:hypothetical protein